jgi:hypothetical protein
VTAAIIHRIRTEGMPCAGTETFDVYTEGFAAEAVERSCTFLGDVVVEIDAVAGEQRFKCPNCGHMNVGPVDADLLHEVAPVVVAASYSTVRAILAARPGRWMTVHQVHALIPSAFRDQLTESVIRAEFGALHDHGQVTRAGEKARFDQ